MGIKKYGGHFALGLLAIAVSQTVWAAEENKMVAQEEKISGETKTADEAGVTEMPLIQVRGVAEAGYKAKKATTATKTDAPIMETPVSVQSVSRSVMDDQQVSSVKDAVRNISGVTSASYEFYDFFSIRGFNNGYASSFRNGLQQQATTGLETANLERIEVLKGPAAVLYGRQQGPGGIINLVTKRPQAESMINVEQQLGSYNYKKTTLDATGAVNQDKTLMYRFVGAYKDNDTFQDFVHQNRKFGSLSMLWQPSAQFEAHVNLEHQNEKVTATGDLGVPFIGNRPVDVPINRNFGDPIQNSIPTFQDRDTVSGDWTYHFDDNWKFTQRFMHEERNEQQNSIGLDTFTPATGILTRGMWLTPLKRQITALDQNIIGHFDALGVKHNLMVGLDYWRYHDSGVVNKNWLTPLIPNINIYNPVYGMNWSSLTAADFASAWATRIGMGVYLQDQIEIGKWRILAAGRFDKFNEDRDWSNIGGTLAHFQDTPFSPRLAALYQLTPQTSLFAGYSKSFGTSNGVQANGATIPPEQARQYEAGLKSESFEGRLLTTVTLFDLAKTNILNPVPGTVFSTATGEMRNRGLELDMTGNIGGGYSIIGSYAYFNPKISKDTNGNQGNMMPNVPVHSANLWGKYDWGSAKNGWGAGLGANIRGQRQVNNANTIQLPGYAIFNAMAEYRFAVNDYLLKAKLNVENLTDKKYWDHAEVWSGAFYGALRTFKASISADF